MNTNQEFTAVILAATPGTRLDPLTISGQDEFDDSFPMDDEEESPPSDPQEESGGPVQDDDDDEEVYLPKHLLPLAGRPIIQHLIQKLIAACFEDVIIAIAAEDEVTVPSLIEMGATPQKCQEEGGKLPLQRLNIGKTKLKVIQLSAECGGSADALRFICSLNDGSEGTGGIIPTDSHVMVMPGDLILYGDLCDENDGDVLSKLADVHRTNFRLGMVGQGPPLALTLLLTDVGETDESGIPLKESAKAKKGSLSREVGDIEYVALSDVGTTPSLPAQRIILKQYKFNVEEDEDFVGKTPKLTIPKARLHPPMNQLSIRSDWNDVHLYCFAPWVLKIIGTKIHLKDLSKEILPLFIESQFRGLKACLGIKGDHEKADKDEDGTGDEESQVLGQILKGSPFARGSTASSSSHGDDELTLPRLEPRDYPFTVLAHTVAHQTSRLIVRACNVASYVYACKEVVSKAIQIGSSSDKSLSCLEGASIDTKSNSIVLKNATLGEKVQIKSSTIGKNVTVGNRCRLNNVIVMDDVKIGENCVLQNFVVSRGCTIGDNCNLKDSQMEPKSTLKKGTKATKEGIVERDI
mmetsp:Transcript_4021/g.5835  ORF Transcript_4021/g.5835 Transcript_4021/m.5835 type:complete len:579 (-) Transcript_4021:751-2487(-)